MNWRMDCSVAGYDNTFGLPPFFPTRLRIRGLHLSPLGSARRIAAAHVDAAQNHTKSNYMRNPVAAEVFNEEVCNLLKRKIKDSSHPHRRPDHWVRLRGRSDCRGRAAKSR